MPLIQLVKAVALGATLLMLVVIGAFKDFSGTLTRTTVLYEFAIALVVFAVLYGRDVLREDKNVICYVIDLDHVALSGKVRLLVITERPMADVKVEVLSPAEYSFLKPKRRFSDSYV